MVTMNFSGRNVSNVGMDYYLIAEAGVNHEGSLEIAKRQVELAREGGAHAIKFQAYKAEKLASVHSPAYWDLSKESTESQYQLFKKHDRFGEKEYVELAQHCKKVGIDFLCTAFDEDSFAFVDRLVPTHKIASADLTNIPLLRMIAKTKKNIVLSTGAANFEEIQIALREIKKAGGGPVSLLHCVLCYPNSDENAFLSRITRIKSAFPDVLVGYSDHTLPHDGCFPVVLSYALGARVFEKHFTHDKSLPGNDHYHSMDVNDLKQLVKLLDRSKQLLKPATDGDFLQAQNAAIKNARRSIVLRSDIAAGTVLNEKHLIPKRPGTGISPLEWDRIIGRKVKTDLAADTVLQWEHLIDQ